ncbi:hypothetical protein AUC68_06800 [Methyloceanibacter methanicus]|uniref:Uncharacterized protein n=1 Tax=Methyloceanibacter methanicus TaxID=1774968 RepID=A0A1E3VZD5_9HYPH|nr:hypothetical protein [Methyloceanibacter methanicus]ODR98880.1 hypothetical protein AUC68_06800 [Methyloceanibacter methanicus]
MTGAAAAATVYGAVNLGSNNSNMMLVDAGGGGLSADIPVWVLAMLAVAMLLSFRRGSALSLPSMMGTLSGASKTWLFAGAGILVYAAYAFT